MMYMEPYTDYYEYGAAAEGLGFAGVILGVMLVFYLLMFAFGVLVYVLQSLGFYQIAKRRGIHNPWLAWLPVGNMWILGSISDQYQYVAKGKLRSRRKMLMGLMIAMLVLTIPMLVGYGALIAGMIAEHSYAGADVMAGAGVTVAVLSYLVYMILTIVAIVFQYIALYDLYMSCDPHNGMMYIVLSIFINITMPFFVFICRKKDYGMPPRKSQPAPQPPVMEPVVEEASVEEAPVEEASVEEAPVEEAPVEEAIPMEEAAEPTAPAEETEETEEEKTE